MVVPVQSGVHITQKYGGSGGKERDLYLGDSVYINKVELWSADKLDSIVAWFSNGASKGALGNSGGSLHTYYVPSGECIEGIIIRHGNVVDGIEFMSSSGRFSDWYGGDGGSYSSFSYNNYCLVGMKIRDGNKIDAITFRFVNTINGVPAEIVLGPDGKPIDNIPNNPNGPDPILFPMNPPQNDINDKFNYNDNNDKYLYYYTQQINKLTQFMYTSWIIGGIAFIIISISISVIMFYNCCGQSNKYQKVNAIDTDIESKPFQ